MCSSRSLLHCLPFLFLTLFLTLTSVQARSPRSTDPRAKLDLEDSFFFKYRSRPDILAPKWDIKHFNQSALSPGYVFIAPYENIDQEERGQPWVGPYIYDLNDGELIWAGPPMFDHRKSFDLRIATVDGVDMMTVIYPRHNAGVMINNNYQIVKEIVHSDAFEHSNMHDFNIVRNGTRALVLTKHNHKLVSKEMSAAVGVDFNCSVHEDGLKELDITGTMTKTVFEWNGTDHIGLDETTVKPHSFEEMCNNNWDIHHFNSIDIFPDGDYLVSSRSTSTLYKISHLDGTIVWRLGGTNSSFTFGTDALFSRQHHARVHTQNATHVVVSLFDNAKGSSGNEVASFEYSRGLQLELDLNTMKVELKAAFDHPEKKIVNSRGSNHIQPDGNVFMGWAYHTLVSEHAPDGTILMQARLKKDIHTYRTYKYEWVGQPSDPPNVVSAAFVAGNHTSTISYVSWNGATEVASWHLYEADMDGQKMKLLNATQRLGFETELTYDGYAEYVLVEALNVAGKVIGGSKLVQTIPAVKPSGNSFTYADDFDEQFSTADVAAILMNPIAIYAIGFLSCLVICVTWWVCWRYQWLTWLRWKVTEYEALRYDRDDQEDRDADEDECYDEKKRMIRQTSMEVGSPMSS